MTSSSDNELLDSLHRLYADQSKHAVYQNIPAFVQQALGYSENINEQWRGDSTRWDYLQERMNFEGQSVLDIGANTGFFTLSLARQYPGAHFTALEGNAGHADFIRLVCRHFSMNNVSIQDHYLDRSGLDRLAHYDTVLLFNVLHHAGVDFDQPLVPNRQALYEYLIDYLRQLSLHTNRLVLQMGYNWGGNKCEPVIDLNDDTGKYLYTAGALREAGWHITAIAAPYPADGALPVEHRDLPEEIVDMTNRGETSGLKRLLAARISDRIEEFSEFYRRPLFVAEHG